MYFGIDKGVGIVVIGNSELGTHFVVSTIEAALVVEVDARVDDVP